MNVSPLSGLSVANARPQTGGLRASTAPGRVAAVSTPEVQFGGLFKDRSNRKLAFKLGKKALDQAAKKRVFWGRVADVADFLPIIGDAYNAAHGTAYVIKGYREGLPKSALVKMAAWTTADVALGVAGTAFSWSPPGWVIKGADMLLVRSGGRVVKIYERATEEKRQLDAEEARKAVSKRDDARFDEDDDLFL